MTAKEITRKIVMLPNDVKKFDLIEHLIKEYARSKCKEQRELCSEHFYWEIDNGNFMTSDKTEYETIKNAPEPNFD